MDENTDAREGRTCPLAMSGPHQICQNDPLSRYIKCIKSLYAYTVTTNISHNYSSAYLRRMI